ncbi:MAG: hypothetical protein ACAI25_01695 [Planctomycetota bacterium]
MRQSLAKLVLASLVTLFVSGCSSTPPEAPPRETATGTGITVIGWSLKDQVPVPVQGVLRQGGQEVARFDTKARPDNTMVPVAPGPYEIQVTHRIAGERAIPASGLERVDARAGEIVRCEVVIDDREGGDTGPVDNSR